MISLTEIVEQVFYSFNAPQEMVNMKGEGRDG